MVLIAILLSTIFISLLSLVGILFLKINSKKIQKLIFWLVCFATGTLLGGAFFHLLPESWELNQNAPLYFIIGILIFFALEKFLYWRHCHKEECDFHAFTYLNVIGDGIHNFIDGVVIAASFITNIQLGIITSLVVASHEIPQELGDFAILLGSGYSRGQALLYNALTGLTTVIGGVVAYYSLALANQLVPYVLAIAASSFIYIAVADLIPGLHKRPEFSATVQQILLIGLGIIVIYATHSTLH